MEITAVDDILRYLRSKSSCKRVSDFGRLRTYDRWKPTREDKDY